MYELTVASLYADKNPDPVYRQMSIEHPISTTFQYHLAQIIYLYVGLEDNTVMSILQDAEMRDIDADEGEEWGFFERKFMLFLALRAGNFSLGEIHIAKLDEYYGALCRKSGQKHHQSHYESLEYYGNLLIEKKQPISYQ